MAYQAGPRSPAIVLAAFGTSAPEALKAITNVEERVLAAFPGYLVRLSFTSNAIRAIWRQRALDLPYRDSHPEVGERFYRVRNPLSELAALQEEGARLVMVQSLHLTDGEEYRDLASLVNSLASVETLQPSLNPFPWMALGQPALGTEDGRPESLSRAALALYPLIKDAQAMRAAVVLVGHGNGRLRQEVYLKFQKVLREAYGPDIYVGTVESSPLMGHVLEQLREGSATPRNVLLAPLMLVAGEHARQDMAGYGEGSWASRLKAEGYQVIIRMEGLGSNDSFADIFVESLKGLEQRLLALKGGEGPRA
jgi:sirohydrochlorin cobaltochelatase